MVEVGDQVRRVAVATGSAHRLAVDGGRLRVSDDLRLVGWGALAGREPNSEPWGHLSLVR